MTNHPNRSQRAAGRSPTGSEVAAARIAAGLSYAECAALVYERPRRWAAFEQDEGRMHPAAWELFQLKTADSAGLRQRLHAFVTPGRHDEAPRAGETWYSKDTGCAIVVTHVEAGLVTARGLRSTVETTAGDWFDNFQRDPVAV